MNKYLNEDTCKNVVLDHYVCQIESIAYDFRYGLLGYLNKIFYKILIKKFIIFHLIKFYFKVK